MCNRDRAKPECLAVFLIESYSFPSVLIIICLSLPLSHSSCHSFPPSTLYPSSPYHTLSYHYTSCPYLYDYTQTTPSRSPSLVSSNISSLCSLCIPQSEYHLRYSSLWSDPVHVLSLTCPPLTLLIKHDLDAPAYILPPSTRPDSCNGHRKVSNALPEPDRSRPTRAAIPLLFPIGRVPFFSGLLGLVPCALAFPRSGVRSHRTLGAL